MKKTFFLLCLLLLCVRTVFATSIQEEYALLEPIQKQIQNPDKTTLTHLEEYAKKGNSVALLLLGSFYQEGKIVPKDIQKTISYFEKSANTGNQMAQLYLGNIYANQDSGMLDLNKAKAFYEKAAQGDNLKLRADALEKIVFIQQLELSLTQIRYHQTAAYLGKPASIIALGNVCLKENKLPCAYTWFSVLLTSPTLSEEQKQATQKIIDTIKGEMTLNQITKAQKEVQNLEKIVKVE